MGIFRKFICPNCFPARYRRSAGTCPKCAAVLTPGPLCVEWIDARGRRRTETVQGGKRAAETLLAKRKGRAHDDDQPQKIRFETLCDEYHTAVSTRHTDQGARDQAAIKNLIDHYGGMLCTQIMRRDVEDYLKPRPRIVGCGRRHSTGETITKQITPSVGTLAREMRLFRSIWKYGQQHYALGRDPSTGVPIKEPRPPIKTPPSLEDEQRAMDALPETSRPFYQFLALTGARTREAQTLLKKDVDIKKNIAWVRHKTRAGDIEREAIHLSEEAVQLVKQQMDLAEGPHVFENPTTKKPWASPKTTFRRTMQRIGLADKIKSPHALRHLFVSRLVEGGVHPIVAMELSRHKDPRTFKRYAHNDPKSLQDALKQARVKK